MRAPTRVLHILLALVGLAAPLQAWEFTANPVCTLAHRTDEMSARVTYDPRLAEPYAIELTRAGPPWPDAPAFSIRFEGPRGLTISTTRHRLSDGGRVLTVTDRGFGNVLDGLEFNSAATALAGPVALTLPLDGAAPAVRQFRACVEGGLVEAFPSGAPPSPLRVGRESALSRPIRG